MSNSNLIMRRGSASSVRGPGTPITWRGGELSTWQGTRGVRPKSPGGFGRSACVQFPAIAWAWARATPHSDPSGDLLSLCSISLHTLFILYLSLFSSLLFSSLLFSLLFSSLLLSSLLLSSLLLPTRFVLKVKIHANGTYVSSTFYYAAQWLLGRWAPKRPAKLSERGPPPNGQFRATNFALRRFRTNSICLEGEDSC